MGLLRQTTHKVNGQAIEVSEAEIANLSDQMTSAAKTKKTVAQCILKFESATYITRQESALVFCQRIQHA